MASTKSTPTVLHNDEAVADGGIDETSATWDLVDGYGGTIYVEIVPTGTLTAGGACQLRASPDDSTFYDYGGPMVTGLAAVTYTWAVPVDWGVKYLKAVIGSNTGDICTFRVEGTEVTAS